jgi:hypothetical protein
LESEDLIKEFDVNVEPFKSFVDKDFGKSKFFYRYCQLFIQSGTLEKKMKWKFIQECEEAYLTGSIHTDVTLEQAQGKMPLRAKDINQLYYKPHPKVFKKKVVKIEKTNDVDLHNTAIVKKGKKRSKMSLPGDVVKFEILKSLDGFA